MAAPQIALLAIALLLGRIGVNHGLKPLTDLAAQIEARGTRQPVARTAERPAAEARVLVDRINELLERLSNAMRAQKRFVADAAHQLRTPLAAVLLHAERAERATDVMGEREALGALHRSVERAARLSAQLLALARTDPEAVSAIELKNVDLTTLARQVGEEWVRRALERDIDFGLSVPDHPVMVTGDERLLSEVLSNLIDNALRYGNPGGHVTLMVEAGEANQTLGAGRRTRHSAGGAPANLRALLSVAKRKQRRLRAGALHRRGDCPPTQRDGRGDQRSQ